MANLIRIFFSFSPLLLIGMKDMRLNGLDFEVILQLDLVIEQSKLSQHQNHYLISNNRCPIF